MKKFLQNPVAWVEKLPSTVTGLLFHSAEHNQWHVGQLLVTAGVLKEKIRLILIYWDSQ